MLGWLCKYLLVSADVSAFTSCSVFRWGEEEMPEALKKRNK